MLTLDDYRCRDVDMMQDTNTVCGLAEWKSHGSDRRGQRAVPVAASNGFCFHLLLETRLGELALQHNVRDTFWTSHVTYSLHCSWM